MSDQISIDDIILKVNVLNYVPERCLHEITTSLGCTDTLQFLRKLFSSIDDNKKNVLIRSQAITEWQIANREELQSILEKENKS